MGIFGDQIFAGFHLNTWKRHVCGIKLEMKEIRCIKFRLRRFHRSMLSITFDNYLLCIKFSQFDIFTEVYHTCILNMSYSR